MVPRVDLSELRVAAAVLETRVPGSPFATPADWRRLTRVAFRFVFVYFSIYVLTTQMLQAMIPAPFRGFPPLERLRPMLPLLMWTATHVFGVTGTPVVLSGSGDKYLNWIAAAWLLAIALVAAVLWSVADRRRRAYPALFEWFRVFLRFALGASMIGYGFAKVVPLQMPYPQLSRFVEPYGHFSMMGVLWYSIGASPAYEIFVGSAEAAGGILLFLPQTALVGSLLCLIDTIAIFALNMTYDVPVKLFSFHLILMSLFLLAPDAQRVIKVLLLNQSVEPARRRPVVSGWRAQRMLILAQAAFGLWLVGTNVMNARQSWYTFGHGAPKPPLYGLWNVDEMTMDGQVRAPLVTDNGRWRRLVVQAPTSLRFQRMDETFADFGAKVDTAAKSIALTKPGDANWRATLRFEEPSTDGLVLAGEVDGQKVRMTLSRIDLKSFLLANSGFHWIQERPFNR
jgi:hypothetical protein